MRAWASTFLGLAIILLCLVFKAFAVIEFHPYFSELLNWTLAICVATIAVMEDQE
jgi:hypothetical protein